MSTTKQITLKSLDGKTFVVDEAVALESQTIKHAIEVDCVSSEIPLPNVNSQILAKVIEYCKRHVEAAAEKDKTVADSGHEKDESLKSFDAEFVKVDKNTLFNLILAANYLNISSLLDLTCQAVADMIKGKTPREILETLNINDDLPPEEEEQIRRENQWAFE